MPRHDTKTQEVTLDYESGESVEASSYSGISVSGSVVDPSSGSELEDDEEEADEASLFPEDHDIAHQTRAAQLPNDIGMRHTSSPQVEGIPIAPQQHHRAPSSSVRIRPSPLFDAASEPPPASSPVPQIPRGRYPPQGASPSFSPSRTAMTLAQVSETAEEMRQHMSNMTLLAALLKSPLVSADAACSAAIRADLAECQKSYLALRGKVQCSEFDTLVGAVLRKDMMRQRRLQMEKEVGGWPATHFLHEHFRVAEEHFDAQIQQEVARIGPRVADSSTAALSAAPCSATEDR